jgi:hypothetical protein
MRITLQELNKSYQALEKLTQKEFPKERHKIAYKLSRILKSAQAELSAATESLNDLQRKCGLGSDAKATSEELADYQNHFNDFVESTYCELWGDPILLADLGEISISAFDLALLDWLIVESIEQPKTQAVNA